MSRGLGGGGRGAHLKKYRSANLTLMAGWKPDMASDVAVVASIALTVFPTDAITPLYRALVLLAMLLLRHTVKSAH
jgi:hypothetical protein